VSNTATAYAGDNRDAAANLLALYDRALPQVYGYLVRRCDSSTIAEDLTADAFMAAAKALLDGTAGEIGIGWLIGTARHKLIDHWRRTERDRKAFTLIATEDIATDPNDEPIATAHAHEVLDQLSAEHRAALTLRYIDGLPVSEVARLLDRSPHATESLIQRAKAAFRSVSAHIEGKGDLS